MVSPILVRKVIIFSETRIGLCAHTVANHPSQVVIKIVTKSLTVELKCSPCHPGRPAGDRQNTDAIAFALEEIDG